CWPTVWAMILLVSEKRSLLRKGKGVMKMQRWRRAQRVSAVVSVVMAILIGTQVSALAARMAGAPAGAAPDGPGSLSHFDLARKDCLGTARNTTSRVWYTVAGGVLSDVYYPTVDNTNVETLQYIVTDGATFTDLQKRDMAYTVAALDPAGMACRVTATAKSGRYRIVTDYLTDPGRATVVMHAIFRPL